MLTEQLERPVVEARRLGLDGAELLAGIDRHWRQLGDPEETRKIEISGFRIGEWMPKVP